MLPTLWVGESSAKLRKNIIGGAMLDNVFQHKYVCFAKRYAVSAVGCVPEKEYFMLNIFLS